MMASEQQLSEVLSEFARTMVTDFPIQSILDHLVERIVDVLLISAAGVTLISPGTDPRYVAASDESALRFEELQTELGEGPCTAADQATKAALAAYPGGVVDRVVQLSDGEYEVHDIGVNWPHHIFVNQDFTVVGAT
jgi:hypothetical protein